MKRWGWGIAVLAALAALLAAGWVSTAGQGGSVIMPTPPSAGAAVTVAALLPVPAARRPAEPDAKTAERLADAAWCQEPPEAEEPDTEASGAAAAVDMAALKRMQARPAAQKLRRAQDHALSGWADALAARGDERGLAAVDFLRSAASPFDDDSTAVLAARQQLFARARQSRDGFVHAMAMTRCHNGLRPADCQGLSPLRWAQVDPGNLQPWLREVGRAHAAKDPQAVHEAMFQIASSTRSQNYQRELATLLLSLPQSDQPGLAMAAQTYNLMGVLSAWPLSAFSPLTRWCEAAKQDVNRAQTCGQVAERLWTGADSLLEAMVSTSLAKRLPVADPAADLWLKRRVKADALMALTMRDAEKRMSELAALTPSEVNNCWGVADMRKNLSTRFQHGEWQVLLKRLETDGITEAMQASLAAQWRAASASAASAASK